MKSTGPHPIGDYIRIWQETIAENVSFCPIYELYVEAERVLGSIWVVIWWYLDVLNEPEE